MDRSATELSAVLGSLQRELKARFRKQQWSELDATLTVLVSIGEHQGRKEICLTAQSLRELIGRRMAGAEAPGARVEELFEQLVFHLSHFQWACRGGLVAPPETAGAGI